MEKKQEPIRFEWEMRNTESEPILSWSGKRALCSAAYCPAQKKELYGAEKNGWRNQLFWGDNLQVMGHLLKDFRGKIDFIYIDPPFNSRVDYKKQIKLRDTAAEAKASFSEKQYGDIWTNDEYLQFMYERIILLRELLSDTGVLALHCDWHTNAYLRMLLDEVFAPDRMVNEIAWCYTSGGVGKAAFGRKHDTIYVYSKTDQYTFHEQYYKRYALVQNGVEVGFDPRVTYHKDKNGRSYRWNLSVDWWSDIGIVSPNSRTEKTGYPTQKPELLVGRLIDAFTDPGDLVFDCFMGSGTTQAVAMKRGRRFLGADANRGSVQTTVERLLAIAENLQQTEDFYMGFEVLSVDKMPTVMHAEAEITIEGHMVVIKDFHPTRLMQKLDAQGEALSDWRQLVSSVMIDFHYDGSVIRPERIDLPGRKRFVAGRYLIPEGAERILVKITDLLSEASVFEL